MRITKTYKPEDIKLFRQKALIWAQQFKEIVWLDSNTHKESYTSYDAILAVEAFTSITTRYKDAFQKLTKYQTKTKDWLFGYLTYDLKNDTENLTSQNFDGLNFPELFFFQPKKLFLFKDDAVEIKYLNIENNSITPDVFQINNTVISNVINKSQNPSPIKIKLRIHKDDYFKKVNTMLEHINRGNIYEANFCQEFYAQNYKINPEEVFNKLNTISQPPFAAYLKLNDKFLMSASPERYIKKVASKIISQPIKGTAKRATDRVEDKQLAQDLKKDPKERSENIMIVDLVRNDLSKTAKKGSVKVKELCKVYSFLQVHQMISTVVSEVDDTIHPVDILKTTFPMGSMTGAPKISAMQIIENLEDTKRGLYSGSVGYFTPKGNFDFNVIIRSILYNKSKAYISYSVGSAITAKSNPVKEYEECLIKAKAMREVLEG